MTTASPQQSDVPTQHLQAITALRKNTTYLWKGLVTLAANKNQLTCPIRQATYERIRQDLTTLCDAGFFEFNLVYGNSGRSNPVIELELTAISDPFRELVSGLAQANGQEPAVPDPVVPKLNSRLPGGASRIPGLKGLPRAGFVPVISAPFVELPWWQRRHAWILMAGVVLLIELVHWFNRPPYPVDPLSPLSAPGGLSRPVVAPTPGESGLPVPASSLHTPAVFTRAVPNAPEQKEEPPGESSAPARAARLIEVEVDVATLPLHEGPSFRSPLLQQLDRGVTLRVIGQANGWLQVVDPLDQTGWVTGYGTRDAITLRRVSWMDAFSLVNSR